MEQHHDILDELEKFASETGVSPASVCRAATKNPRMYERLKSRLEQTRRQVALIRDEMDRQRASRKVNDA